ncbi:DUF4906 domain-containing protein [Parabacteroides sp.]
MTLLSLVLMNTGCEEQIDPANIPSEGGKMVEVSLNIGFADEADGYTIASKSDASSNKGAFSYELQPSVVTKEDATIKPDKLYNLEIQQYNQSGTRIGGIREVTATREIGSAIELSLKEDSNCQLVIVAWGDGNTTRLGTTNTLATVQKQSVIDASIINGISTDNMKKMPYVLHLEHVKVSSDGKVQSPEGEDVRLLLKRLAARLTLNWKYSYSGYTLNQILLESIPTNYNVVPNPDKTDKTYPSLLDQFTTIKIDPTSLTPDLSEQYTYSCWVPANVRGSNSSATSQNYRIKSNAPTGSSYASFIAGNTSDAKKKLNYRVYLGGSTTFDFNINSNTNYNYTVRFTHTDLPVNDRRVTIIDPIPASEKNSNLVPTANCFMVAPGGAFCFDPFKYQANGSNEANTVLKGWVANGEGGIASVKVLWQTKENGDIGDPVLGTVTSNDDHTNIVDIKRKDGTAVSTTSPLTDADQGYIYCRVAPNTTGGSGVIAAYNVNGEIIWSWHIWVTDYAPNAYADESVDDPKKRVQLYTYGKSPNAFPMMDRNLGAQAGYTDVPDGDLAKSKANGFHFQCGRKDPFPSTYSASLGNELTINTDKLTPGMLNYYGPDGISYFVRTTSTNLAANIRTTFKNPTTTYGNSKDDSWFTGSSTNMWTDMNANLKTFHDPCPAGWRVASKTNYRSLFKNTSYEGSSGIEANESMNIKTLTDGGAVVYYKSNNGGETTYIRLTGYQPFATIFKYIGGMGNLWCRETGTSNHGYALSISPNGYRINAYNICGAWALRDAHPVRCIQDRYKNE